jgi:tetratricopeptide (TPR) repeat protein
MKRLLLVLLVAGCHGSPPWSATAARVHAEADRLIDAGDRSAARAALVQLVSDRIEAPAETRRAVLQDAYFRLARLALDGHDAAQAARDADAGLALSGADDLFVANLLVVRGAAHEALGEPAAAVAVYQRALRINEALLREEVDRP